MSDIQREYSVSFTFIKVSPDGAAVSLFIYTFSLFFYVYTKKKNTTLVYWHKTCGNTATTFQR